MPKSTKPKRSPKKKGSSKAKRFRGPLDEIEQLLREPDELESRVIGIAYDSALYTAAFVSMAEHGLRTLGDASETQLAEFEAAREALLTASFDINSAFTHRIAERTYAQAKTEQLKAAARAHRCVAEGFELVLRSIGHQST